MKVNFYSSGQAARELQISSYRIRRLCETGLISGAEFSEGKQWLVPQEEVARLAKEGVPAIPRTIDADAPEPKQDPGNGHKQSLTLLAAPSDEMISKAEEAEISGRDLTTAKNQLERKKIAREAVEVEDFFEARERARREQEAEQERRDEEAMEEHRRQVEAAAAKQERHKFFSRWIDYAMKKKPWGAPDDIDLEIHAQVLTALAATNSSESEFAVRRIVDAAVNRALAAWRNGEQKRQAVDQAITRLPFDMHWANSPWKAQVKKIATEAADGLRAGASSDEIQSAVELALRPLVAEYKHSELIKLAMLNTGVSYANTDERSEAEDAVKEAIAALPVGVEERQINRAKEQALAPIRKRVTERLEKEQRAEQRAEVSSRASYHLHWELSATDKQAALEEIEEALDGLPAGASVREMEAARDEVAKRYKKKLELIKDGLRQIQPYAEHMLKKWNYEDTGETARSIESRLSPEVKETLEEELTGKEDAEFVTRLVQRTMRELEGCR